MNVTRYDFEENGIIYSLTMAQIKSVRSFALKAGEFTFSKWYHQLAALEKKQVITTSFLTVVNTSLKRLAYNINNK